MKVKINNQIFDSDIQPIMLILNNEEKELISNMGSQTRFCSFPVDMDVNDVQNFMIDREGGVNNYDERY